MPISLLRSASGLRVAIVTIFAVLVGAYLAALVTDSLMLDRLSWEDGIIENAGAICFLAAAVGFFCVSALAVEGGPAAPGHGFRRKVVFGVLAVLMFVCFGEEISWGQRIFGWSTPAAISELNAQNETNLHNLQIVHQWNEDGSEKDFAGKLVNMNRLFSIFWLTVFVLLPVMARLSDLVRRLIDTAGITLPPLWTGALFLTSFAIYKVLAFVYADSIRAHALDEIKETNYAAIYAFIAFVALAEALRRRKVGDEVPAEPPVETSTQSS